MACANISCSSSSSSYPAINARCVAGLAKSDLVTPAGAAAGAPAGAAAGADAGADAGAAAGAPAGAALAGVGGELTWRLASSAWLSMASSASSSASRGSCCGRTCCTPPARRPLGPRLGRMEAICLPCESRGISSWRWSGAMRHVLRKMLAESRKKEGRSSLWSPSKVTRFLSPLYAL
eukprot:scaffold58946_cov63-Phaeocystis_antarctica.AAC.6